MISHQQIRRVSTRITHAIALVPVLVAATPSHAEERPWWAHVGVVHVMFHERSVLSSGGVPVAGADAKASDNTTLGLELGYRLSQHWATAVMVGVPPTSTVTGAGTVAPLGAIGKVTYAPLVISGQYRFGSFGAVRPYLGAGAVYYMVLDAQDGALRQLSVKTGWGSSLQAGLELPLGERYGLFLDLKRMFVRTTATGVLPALGGAPARADVKLNPLVVHVGLSASF